MNEEQRAAYRARLIAESRTAHTWIKQEVSLIDFATDRLGWRVNKKKTSKRDVVLKHEQHETIIAPSRPRGDSGHWVFSWADGNNPKKGGTLIDLLRLEGWEWKEIDKLAGEVIAHRPVASLPAASKDYEQQGERDPNKQTARAQERFNQLKDTGGTSYLEQRGIDKAMYMDFPQMKVNNREAIFKLYDVVEGKAHLCSTTNYYFDREGNSKKYFHKGLPRGLAVLREAGPVERLVISESPVDALSWKQVEALQSKNPEAIPGTMYVSTCGSLSKNIKADISHLFEEARKKGQSVVLARDNDEAGIKISSELAAIADKQGVVARMSIPPAGEKDWNDYLRSLRKEMAQEAQQGMKLVSSKTVEAPHAQQAQNEVDKEIERPVDVFKVQQQAHPMKEVLSKKPAYKGTLLEELAIDEKACKGLKGYESSKKQITFPLYTSGHSVKASAPIGSYQIRLEEEGLRNYHEAGGTAPGLVVLPSEKPAKSIVVTSSPLDIFLHRAEQQRTDVTYISTCGQDAKEIKAPLRVLLDEHQGKDVRLYMNDKEAQALQKQLVSEPGKAVNYAAQSPQEALWRPHLQQVAYEMNKIMRQDPEEWEPIKPKRRHKGKGHRLRAV